MEGKTPYVSVNLTEEQNSFKLSWGIRRWWNRLPRLKKSVLLMTGLIIFGFSWLLVMTWPPESGSYQHHQQQQQRELERKKFTLADSGAGERLATVRRGLKRDEDGVVAKKSEGAVQISKNSRNVIALDPVVPLGAKKSILDIIKPLPGAAVVVAQPRSRLDAKLELNGVQNARQKAVVEAFLHAWKGYKKYAWGKDHLKPISKAWQDWFSLGLTLVDSLDTMWIMNLRDEFDEAKQWVSSSLSFDVAQDVNLFETTIRVMGGLLSAFHLSGDKVFKNKAEELGAILVLGFNSPSGVPYSDINLRTKSPHGPAWNPDSTTSEVSTLQLEFRDLSRITGKAVYEDSAMNVSIHIHTLPKLEGLVPIFITPSTGAFRSSATITLGARGDSYYEYLLKQWIQTGKTIDFLLDDYLRAVEGIQHLLVQRTKISNLTFIGELENGGHTPLKPKMDHLVCYLPGTLALGVLNGLPAWHMELAKSLLYTCYQTYKRQPTGLSPEITFFQTDDDAQSDIFVKKNDAHNLLRPETVESLWYLYQITGDPKYQEWGWEIFQSFLKYTRVENGFTSISSVLTPDNPRPRDMMESFFLGETLKYFYLLFSDRPIFDLNSWVFNTEAHPFPVRDH